MTNAGISRLGSFALAGFVCVVSSVYAWTQVTGTISRKVEDASGAAVAPEKALRTPAQRKIDSQLLTAIYRRSAESSRQNVPPAETGVKIDTKGRALVDVRVDVTLAMQKKITALGSTIISTSAEYRSIVAWVPLLKLEALAGDAAVRAIVPQSEAMTNTPVTNVPLR